MPRRSENRDKSREAFLQSGGKKTNKELAEEFGTSADVIRKWKREDQWLLQLKKKRGGQPGNKNSAGKSSGKGNRTAKGGPEENSNAKTHGAYAKPDSSDFSEEEKQAVNMAQGLSALAASLTQQEIYLKKSIEKLEADTETEKFDTGGVDVFSGKKRKGSMVYWEDKEARLEKLRKQHSRTVNSLIKLYDTLRVENSERARLELEKQRLQLSREKAIGIFDMED